MTKILSLKNFPRAIFHIDADAFFVGVEVAKNPKLKGLPVVTGRERGIVSALSYEAKALGITRGLPIYKVKKYFPKVLILPGDYASYVLYSKQMSDIVRRYADVVEEYSIDECFADLTGLCRPLKMTYRDIIHRIKTDINKELNLSVSVGLAPTKVLAKVASKWNKPDGLTVIPGKCAHEFLMKTPIENVWGIGPSTSRFLIGKGIKTALDLAEKDEVWVKNFLNKHHSDIWKELNCQTVYEVDSQIKTKHLSIQKTKTFSPPTSNTGTLLSELSRNLEDACSKARYHDLVAARLSFFLKTQKFKYIFCKISFISPLNLPELILPHIKREFLKMHNTKELYRATGVTLLNLSPRKVCQADLFGETLQSNKFEIIHKQMDSLEKKYGRRVVHLASSQSALGGREERKREALDLDTDLLFL